MRKNLLKFILTMSVLMLTIIAPMTNIEPGHIEVHPVFAEKGDVIQDYQPTVDKMNVYVLGAKASNSTPEYSSSNHKFIGVQAKFDEKNLSKLTKVPDEFKENFIIKINGSNNKEPLKIYREPNQLTTSSKVSPSSVSMYTEDMNIYNNSYIKVKDDKNNTYYISMYEADWEPITKKNIKVVGKGENVQVISAERNITTDVVTRTNLTANDLRKITAGTSLEGIEEAVVHVEEEYGINSLFTLSVAALESGWGNSHFAKTRNNLFGICAYDSNLDATKYFGSKSDCVYYFGRLIRHNYINEGRTNLTLINDIYASNQNWKYEVGSLMNQMISEVRN